MNKRGSTGQEVERERGRERERGEGESSISKLTKRPKANARDRKAKRSGTRATRQHDFLQMRLHPPSRLPEVSAIIVGTRDGKGAHPAFQQRGRAPLSPALRGLTSPRPPQQRPPRRPEEVLDILLPALQPWLPPTSSAPRTWPAWRMQAAFAFCKATERGVPSPEE
jgi:hypothetical protein